MRVAILFFGLIVLAANVAAQVLNTTAFQLVNSRDDEQAPVISPDGKALYFTISNHDQNVGGKKDPGDIWVSLWVGGQWSAPVHGGPVLNNRGYNAVAGLSGDGSQLFLHGHYDPTGATARTQGIAVSRNTGGGWSQPENIYIPYFQNKSTQVGGYVSADKGVFVFSADTYGTRGVEDIYVSFNEDGRWTEPRNVGGGINTQFQELSPSVSADGKTLWLSGRYDHVVYAFDTATGNARVIKVGIEPHGLAVWPQPGRYSLGHTGNMR